MNKCSCKGTPKIAEKPEGYYRFYVYCPICGKKTDMYPSKGGAEFNWDEYVSTGRIKYEPILSETNKRARHHSDACEMMKLYCQNNGFDIESASIVIDYPKLSEMYIQSAGNIDIFGDETVWNDVIVRYIKENEINFGCKSMEQRLSREFRHAITSAGFSYSDQAEAKLIDMYKTSHEKTASLYASAASVYEMKAWIRGLVKIKKESIQNHNRS